MHAGAVARRGRRKQQYRHRVGVGLRHARECVLRARTRLHREHARAPAVRYARVRVSKVHAHALLPEYQRTDASLRRRLFQRVEGDDPHEVHALLLKYPCNQVCACHVLLPCRRLVLSFL